MSAVSRGAVLWTATSLVFVIVVAQGVGARGGGVRGGGAVGGFNRVGPAAWGQFSLPAAAYAPRAYEMRGPAADGGFGMDRVNQDERQELRQGRREDRRDEPEDVQGDRREDVRDYADERRDDDSYAGGDDEGGDPPMYSTLPCTPNTIAMGGSVFYVCGNTYYMQAYGGDDVVYVEVPNPNAN